MGYIAVITDADEPTYGGGIASGLLLGCSADMVRGIEDTDADYWDWVGGYAVVRTSRATHDGKPATLMVLADSDGQREIGRMVIRNDALRSERLEIVRQFQSDEDRAEFLRQLTERPALLDDSWVKVPARAVLVGDRIFIEGDPDDPDVNGTIAPVTGVEPEIADGRIEYAIEIGEAEAFNPCSNGVAFFLESETEVWVKRAG